MLALYLWTLVGPMAVSGLVVGWVAGFVGTRAALAGLSVPLAAYALYALATPVAGVDADEPAQNCLTKVRHRFVPEASRPCRIARSARLPCEKRSGV